MHTLELPQDAMRELAYRIVDLLVDHQTYLSHEPAIRKLSPQELFPLVDKPFPEAGRSFDEVLADLAPVLDSRARVDHPRFFAYVPIPGNFVGAMADALVAGLNVFAGTWISGSGPNAIEAVTLPRLESRIGLPPPGRGPILSGGALAQP